MVLRWSEEQLREYEAQRARPESFRPLRLALDWLPPLGNQWQRMHWSKQRKVRERIALCLVRQLPLRMEGLPIGRAVIRATRFSSNVPDQDGLNTSLKPVLDVLQPRSDRHPNGLGVIVDDAPAHLRYTIEHHMAPPRKGCMIIEVDRE